MFTPTVLAAAPHFAPLGVGFGVGLLFLLGHVFWFVVIVALIIAFVIRRRRWARGGVGPWGRMSGASGVGGWSDAGSWGHVRPGAFWASHQAARHAETTLAERFAQGDIDEKEYRARLEVLRANVAQPPMGPETPAS